jgi:hypothetical protein
MTLFILFQTDQWKSKASRVFLGVFDCRKKAIDCAKYHGLFSSTSDILIEEISLNICEECQ